MGSDSSMLNGLAWMCVLCAGKNNARRDAPKPRRDLFILLVSLFLVALSSAHTTFRNSRAPRVCMRSHFAEEG